MISPDIIEQAQERVGRTLCGKWRLDRVIGVGGMASVYEATHRNKNRVAIKLLHPVLSLEAGTRERFLREGYVANTIQHRGAVRILDDDRAEDGSAFLVMELLHGENVEQKAFRQGGILSPREALYITDQLLDLLSVAHDHKVVHRDIKPDNLFWTDDDELKLLDFGIARLSRVGSGATTVGSFMGTPAFSAPEQARGRWDEVDERTDLFAVGATLFTLLSGAHVHQAETSSEQLALAISAPARSLLDVVPSAPRSLVRLIDKALQYNKQDRFQSARAFRTEVQRLAAEMPDTPLLTEPGDRKSPTARTLPTLPTKWFRWGGTASRLGLGVTAALCLALLLLWIGPLGEPDVPTAIKPLTTPASQQSPPRSPEPAGDGKRDSVQAPPATTEPQAGSAEAEGEAEGPASSRPSSGDRREASAVPASTRPAARAPVATDQRGTAESGALRGEAVVREEVAPARAVPPTPPSETEDLFDRRY